MNATWRLVYTKPRCEMKLSKKLQELGFESYCPTRKTVKQWSDRKKKIEEPLFTSYVFLKMDDSQVDRVVWVPGFSRFVYWLGKPVQVRDTEIESTKLFLSRVAHHSIVVDQFNVGQSVKIARGPLKDQSGIIIEKNKKKVILQIDSLGTLVKAELALTEILS